MVGTWKDFMKKTTLKKLAFLAFITTMILQATASKADRAVASGIRNSEGKEYNLIYHFKTNHGINYTSYYLSQDEKWDYDKDIKVFDGDSFSDGETCVDKKEYSAKSNDYALISSSWDLVSRIKNDSYASYIYIYATYLDCKQNMSKVAETIEISPDNKGGFEIIKINQKQNNK
jgi:hypothetical protein